VLQQRLLTEERRHSSPLIATAIALKGAAYAAVTTINPVGIKLLMLIPRQDLQARFGFNNNKL
jgi:hypothetical protein